MDRRVALSSRAGRRGSIMHHAAFHATSMNIDELSGRYKFVAVKNNANMYVKASRVSSWGNEWERFGSKFYMRMAFGSLQMKNTL